MDSTFRALMAAHGPLNIEDLDTDPKTGYPLALDGLPIFPNVEPDPLAAYPFEVTLPVDERYGRFGLQFTTFYRTFFCRQERWGEGDEVRVGALFRNSGGELKPLRNPYTLALLREALGIA